MRATEHILVDLELRKFLNKKKKNPKESYNQVLRRLLKLENNIFLKKKKDIVERGLKK